jgi:AraC-like DNA-binding protein
MSGQAHERAFYVTAPLLWPMLLGLSTLGVDLETLLPQAGLSLEDVRDPDARISVERGLVLVRLAVEATGDENLGLHLAQRYEPGAFGVIDHLANSARNLREAIEVLCRYERIHQNGMRTSLHVEGERAIMSHTMLHPYPVPRAIQENTLANLLVIGRKLTGVDYAPLEAWFSHPAPRDVREQEQFFRCPLRWNAPHDSLIIAASLLDTPLRNTNPGLASVLERYALELLDKLSVKGSCSDQVREHICQALPRGNASLEIIATELALTPRTLQRRLRAEGTSHEALLDQLRHTLAMDYLQRSGLGTEDVAVMLGFADSRGFRRAFKRWTGMSPSELRRKSPT